MPARGKVLRPGPAELRLRRRRGGERLRPKYKQKVGGRGASEVPRGEGTIQRTFLDTQQKRK